MQKKTGKYFDYRDISIKFTRNLPVDLATTAQIITQLKGVISQETALSLLNFVENPKLELEKYRNEQDYNMIDLEKVNDNGGQ
nr:phage portal protein [Clostridium pasteurianum]